MITGIRSFPGFSVIIVSLVTIGLTACGGGSGSNSGSSEQKANALSFATPIRLNADNPHVFAVADIDGDGFDDLVVPSSTGESSILRIYFGDEDASFARVATTDSDFWSGQIAVADVTDDGSWEVLVDGDLGCSIAIYRLSDSFEAGKIGSYSTGSCGFYRVTLADLNNNSVMDSISDTAAINWGNGDGTFSSAYTPHGILSIGSVVIGDWNANGNADIAGFDNAGTVYVLLGNGDGTFAPPVAVSAPNDGSSSSGAEIKAADITGNGITDLIAHNGSLVFTFIGNGDGTFEEGIVAIDNRGNIVQSIAVADFNLDGRADLAVAEPNHGQAVRIYFGNGEGKFYNPREIDVGAPDAFKLEAHDLGGDGRPDLVVAHGWHNTVGVIRNTSAH